MIGQYLRLIEIDNELGHCHRLDAALSREREGTLLVHEQPPALFLRKRECHRLGTMELGLHTSRVADGKQALTLQQPLLE